MRKASKKGHIYIFGCRINKLAIWKVLSSAWAQLEALRRLKNVLNWLSRVLHMLDSLASSYGFRSLSYRGSTKLNALLIVPLPEFESKNAVKSILPRQ